MPFEDHLGLVEIEEVVAKLRDMDEPFEHQFDDFEVDTKGFIRVMMASYSL